MRLVAGVALLACPLLCLAAGPDLAPVPSGPTTAAATETHRLPAWLTLNLELRGRFENPIGPVRPPGYAHSYYLHRMRFKSGVKLPAGFRLFAELQDSEELGFDQGPLPGSLVDTFDFRQAYLEYVPVEHQRWRVRAGRQALAFGQTRLIGSSNWGNVGPSWDAADLAYARPGLRVEGFASSPVFPVVREFDVPHTWTKVSGVYSTFDKLVRNGLIDAYVFWKLQGEGYSHLPGGISSETWGFRAVGQLPLRFDYNTETAIQRGRAGVNSVRAWAGHYAAGYTLPKKCPHLFAQYDYASGDGNPNDGTLSTFDQLYPTYKWGSADGIGWRNIQDPAIGADWNPRKPLTLFVAYHRFWLANRRDSLYSQSNGVYVKAFDAASGKVGRRNRGSRRVSPESIHPLHRRNGQDVPRTVLETGGPRLHVRNLLRDVELHAVMQSVSGRLG